MISLWRKQMDRVGDTSWVDGLAVSDRRREGGRMGRGRVGVKHFRADIHIYLSVRIYIYLRVCTLFFRLVFC